MLFFLQAGGIAYCITRLKEFKVAAWPAPELAAALTF